MGHNRNLVPFYVLFFLGILVAVEAKNVSPCNFPAIYNFGDSNSATSCDSSHAAKPKTTPRNFRLIVDFLAKKLGKPHLCAYMGMNETNFKQGANFAVPGSIIRHVNESLSPYFGDQTARFLQFKIRTIHLQRKGKRHSRRNDFSKALYTIDIGENDLARSMYGRNIQEIPDMIHQFAAGVKMLYKEGARAFWIHNTGPIGCLSGLQKFRPSYMSADLDKFGCLESYNNVSLEFNKQLKNKVIKLRNELKEAAITYVDVYAVKYKLFSNAKKLGFADHLKICKNGNVTCTDPSKYLLWEGIHYTGVANRLISLSILDGSYSDPPLAITHACYRDVI